MGNDMTIGNIEKDTDGTNKNWVSTEQKKGDDFVSKELELGERGSG